MTAAAAPLSFADAPWIQPLAVSLLAAAGPGPCIALTAALEREGTSTIVFNLARILEESMRERVAVLDANFANPALARLYGLDAGAGLAEVLRGTADMAQALQVTPSGRLGVLAAGRVERGDFAALCRPRSLAPVLDWLRKAGFDVILLDCPAVMTVPEGALAAAQADNAVLVVEAERTRWEVARRAAETLANARVPLSGAVLNRLPRHIPRAIYRLF